ncbi:hypothetical protein F4677DRAFT_438946 [Hypoxylon crocopeplum]|nr:hypothetical protein F4677DRAFT_438946 [Hypoxylon crocopeplum]
MRLALMFSNVIFIAAFLASVSAQIPGPAKRDTVNEARQQPRDTDEQCQSAAAAASSLYADLPTPPPALLTMSLPSDPCATSVAFSGDASAASQFSTYTSKVLDWYTSHSAQLQSALAPCSSLASYVTAQVPVCTSAGDTTSTESDVGPISTSSDGGGSSPTSGTTDGASSSPTETPNVAPRETGLAGIVAIAAAGFMGALAAL